MSGLLELVSSGRGKCRPERSEWSAVHRNCRSRPMSAARRTKWRHVF